MTLRKLSFPLLFFNLPLPLFLSHTHPSPPVHIAPPTATMAPSSSRRGRKKRAAPQAATARSATDSNKDKAITESPSKACSATDSNKAQAITQSTSGFFALPAELRNHIYHFLLISDDGIIDFKDIHTRTAIICTCREIQDQAKYILFKNEVRVECGTGEGIKAARWLNALGNRARLIKKLHINFDISDEMDELCECANELDVEDQENGTRNAYDAETECIALMSREAGSLSGVISQLIKDRKLSIDVVAVVGADDGDEDAPTGEGGYLQMDMCLAFMRKWFEKLGMKGEKKHRKRLVADPHRAMDKLRY